MIFCAGALEEELQRCRRREFVHVRGAIPMGLLVSLAQSTSALVLPPQSIILPGGWPMRTSPATSWRMGLPSCARSERKRLPVSACVRSSTGGGKAASTGADAPGLCSGARMSEDCRRQACSGSTRASLMRRTAGGKATLHRSGRASRLPPNFVWENTL